MKLLKLCLIFLFVFTISCTTSFESIGTGVQISTTENDLIIKNHTSDIIYYFVAEQNVLALILWAPSTSGPSIERNKSVKIPFSEILNGSRIEPVQSGDNVVVFWWTDDFQDFNDVHHKVIKI